MLFQLATLKTRLGLDEYDVKFDALLTNAAAAITARFDRECNRTLARAENALHEFPAVDLEIRVAGYPIESVSKFELKEDEVSGWTEQNEVSYLIRNRCVISLRSALDGGAEIGWLARVTYTGGYVLPGASVGAGQTALPADLEQAALEQAAYWFQNREKLGLLRIWPHQGTYQQLAMLDLLPAVTSVLKSYQRW